MEIPVLDTPIEIKEERSYTHRFEREFDNGNPRNWAAATYEFRIALDTAGNYPVLTVTATVNNNILEIDITKEQNNLKGGKKYYWEMVVIYENGDSYTEFAGIINALYSI